MIVPHSLIRSEVEDLYDRGGYPKGQSTGWPSVDANYTVAMNQWTLITGNPNSGKSEWLDALMVNLARTGKWKFWIYSPENQPLALHHAKIIEKVIGKPFDPGPTERLTKQELIDAEEWMAGKFIFCKPDKPTIESILVEGIKEISSVGTTWKTGIVLDPWNYLEHHRPNGLSETEYVSDVLSRVITHVREHYVHLWLVAHPAKQQPRKDGTYAVPTPRDISGCHDEKTDVLTRRGWVRHADVTLDDEVACFDPEGGVLRYSKPEKIWSFLHEGKMVRLESDSFDACVTPNHRMVVRPIWRRKPSLQSRLKLTGKGRPVVFPIGEEWSFVTAENLRGQLEMPWATEWDEPRCELKTICGLPADDMLKFIGWWVAEGWVDGVKGLGICQRLGSVADEMREVMQRLDILSYERTDAPRRTNEKATMWKGRVGRRGRVDFCDWFIQNCGKGALNKKLPDCIWGASLKQKQILLNALIDGDGSRSKLRPGHSSYATVSPVLADQVQRLAIECGHMASVRGYKAGAAHHKYRYQVNIGRLSRKSIGLEVKRHVKTEHYSGMVYCLTVPGGAYLVRRNGKPGIYGNSAHFWNKADNCITVWRDQAAGNQDVEIHVQKIRWKHVGKIGTATLQYNRVTGQYREKLGIANYYGDRETA